MTCVMNWRYPVVSYKGSTIRVGCNKLPMKGIPAVYEAVNGEKLTEKRYEGPGCGR